MAAESGGADRPLIQLLFDDSYRFSFFQAVRLLERIYPERQPIGRDGDAPAREVARFRTRPSLAFPASEIYQITRPTIAEDEPAPPEMIVTFLGLTGPLGLLPHHYTELVAERVRYKDTALGDFLDLFNHRMISLFYRAWEKYRFPIAYERGELDRFTEYLFDLIGMGTKGLRGNRLEMPDQGLLFYGGLVAQHPHSASAVEAIVGDYFNVPAHVGQFAGQWLKLDDENFSRLGVANSQLGISAIAGTRVWDDQSRFRINLGPLRLDEFKAFLPVGSAFKPVMGLVRFLVGKEFDFDIRLVLKAEEVPDCKLGTRAAEQPMLGWTTWLNTRGFTKDDSQVVLSARA